MPACRNPECGKEILPPFNTRGRRKTHCCKRCGERDYYLRNREKINAQTAALGRKWRRENPEKARAYANANALKYIYGLTPEGYAAMLAAQGGRCDMCGTTDPGNKRVGRFYVDHDHATGANRGLLCHQCNAMLGYARDRRERLEQAITYLAKWTPHLVAV